MNRLRCAYCKWYTYSTCKYKNHLFDVHKKISIGDIVYGINIDHAIIIHDYFK